MTEEIYIRSIDWLVPFCCQLERQGHADKSVAPQAATSQWYSRASRDCRCRNTWQWRPSRGRRGVADGRSPPDRPYPTRRAPLACHPLRYRLRSSRIPLVRTPLGIDLWRRRWADMSCRSSRRRRSLASYGSLSFSPIRKSLFLSLSLLSIRFNTTRYLYYSKFVLSLSLSLYLLFMSIFLTFFRSK